MERDEIERRRRSARALLHVPTATSLAGEAQLGRGLVEERRGGRRRAARVRSQLSRATDSVRIDSNACVFRRFAHLGRRRVPRRVDSAGPLRRGAARLSPPRRPRRRRRARRDTLRPAGVDERRRRRRRRATRYERDPRHLRLSSVNLLHSLALRISAFERPRPGVKENFFLCSVRKRKWGADWLECQSDRLLPGRRGLNTARDSIKISPVVCMMRDRPGSAHAHRENA